MQSSYASGADGPYLGCGPPELSATGFFRVENIEGRWWFVTPDGRRFISTGINHIQFNGYDMRPGHSPYREAVEELYGNTAGWANATRERMLQWGFNTIGAWSDYSEFERMPYTVILNLARLGGGDWLRGSFPDVFDPKWERAVNQYCRKTCSPLADDPFLVGYFTDNELRWGPDWRGPGSLLDDFLKLPESSPGYQAAFEFRKEFRGNKKRAGQEFARLVAEKYFQVTSKALRQADPNHLNLGCRFHAMGAPPGVIEEAGKYVDVVSVNFYDMLPRFVSHIIERFGNVPMYPDWMETYATLSKRPLMITEFSYKAAQSDVPNLWGAGSVVATQKQRADRFENYVTRCLQTPYVIGYHWYNYMDIPGVRSNPGAIGNYGVVDGKDRPYTALVERMTEINCSVCALHQP